MRANADPNAAYIDTRVSDLLDLTEGMGEHLRIHNVDSWDHMNKMTLAIFVAKEDEMKRQMEAFAKMQEEQSPTK